MPTPQLITNATNNVTGMFTFFQYVQEATNNQFFPLILFALLIIIFIVSRGVSSSNGKPFGVASFFVMVLGILFRTMGFISNKWMYLFITFAGIGVVWVYLENSAQN